MQEPDCFTPYELTEQKRWRDQNPVLFIFQLLLGYSLYLFSINTSFFKIHHWFPYSEVSFPLKWLLHDTTMSHTYSIPDVSFKIRHLDSDGLK